MEGHKEYNVSLTLALQECSSPEVAVELFKEHFGIADHIKLLCIVTEEATGAQHIVEEATKAKEPLQKFIEEHLTTLYFLGEETWEEIKYNGELIDVNVFYRAELDPAYVDGDELNAHVTVYGTMDDVHNIGFRTTDLEDERLSFDCKIRDMSL